MTSTAELVIQLENVHRRFGPKIIFQEKNILFKGPGLIGITGVNGRGKSTLLKILAGLMRPDQGHVSISVNGLILAEDQWPKSLVLSGPYIDLPEQIRLKELLALHKHLLGKLYRTTAESKLLDLAGLLNEQNQFIQAFSSGMKQRVRLLLAFLSDVPFWLLDEPASNLDQAGFEFYSHIVGQEKNIRLILVASNQPESELLDAKEIYEL
ncbi:MAG: ATP-binding cassette domain-containing protein [Bacteroidetes bacterium]|nr:ATP-binding cassette domain-containing protein [Bacteroidota bacterium]